MINRDIFRIAIPNILSTITIPMMGIASTAIAARCSDDAVHSIGQLSIGVAIINFIYWNCGFLKMGTTGLTAQAFGAQNRSEITNMIYRSVGIALLLGITILIFSPLISWLGIDMMGGGEDAREYVRIRLWALPAGIIIYAIQGWFAGMQNALIPFIIAMVVNCANIGVSIFLSIYNGMELSGLAYACVVAQWSGVSVALAFIFIFYRQYLVRVAIGELFQRRAILRFFEINRDIVIRILCVGCVYSFFTAASSRMDNELTLAVNTLLLQMFTIYSYISDGLADAAESLTGRFIGARDELSLKRYIKRCAIYSICISAFFVVLYVGGWQQLLMLLVDNNDQQGDVIAHASEYIGWIMVIPITASFPFMMDGILSGATYTHIMRNSMIISTAAFFSIYYIFVSFMGNNALWLAFSSYMLLRSLVQYIMTNKLRRVYDCAKL